MARVSKAVQTLESEGGRLERWTVDEILDGRVRLLVCEPRVDAAVAREIGGVLAEPGAATAAEGLRQLAMRLELPADEDLWTDEEAHYVGLGQLIALLRRRRGRALPRDRELREGDVFLVAATGSDQAATDVARGAEWSIARYRPSDSVVLDLTAAARQATKVSYTRAVVTGTPEPGPA